MQSFAVPPRVLVEPFAGGGIISLTAAFERLADRVVLMELDHQIAAVWGTILEGDAEWLARRIVSFDLSVGNAKAELARKPSSRRELAFQTILKNRTAHGGILADGAGISNTERMEKEFIHAGIPRPSPNELRTSHWSLTEFGLSTVTLSPRCQSLRIMTRQFSLSILPTPLVENEQAQGSIHIMRLTMPVSFQCVNNFVATSC